MPDDDASLTIEIRYRGRRYGADMLPSGSTSITLDGMWLCNGNWNTRNLDIGLQVLGGDLYESEAIRDALSQALGAALDANPGALLDPRKRGGGPRLSAS